MSVLPFRKTFMSDPRGPLPSHSDCGAVFSAGCPRRTGPPQLWLSFCSHCHTPAPGLLLVGCRSPTHPEPATGLGDTFFSWTVLGPGVALGGPRVAGRWGPMGRLSPITGRRQSVESKCSGAVGGSHTGVRRPCIPAPSGTRTKWVPFRVAYTGRGIQFTHQFSIWRALRHPGHAPGGNRETG